MSTALVITPADPSGNPRPNRMIRCLARDLRVHVLSSGTSDLPGVICEPLPVTPRPLKLLRLATRHYERLFWTPSLRALALLPTLLLVIAGPDLFGWVFGDESRKADVRASLSS